MTSTDDLIARLRVNTNPYNYDPRSLLCQYGIERIEAADRLTALQDRVKELEGALLGFTEHEELQDREYLEYLSADLNDKLDRARAVLAKGGRVMVEHAPTAAHHPTQDAHPE